MACSGYLQIAKGTTVQRRMDILKKNSKSKSVSMFPVLVLVHVFVCVRVHVNIKFGAMNIYVLHGHNVVDSQGSKEVARKLKGPPT